MKACREDGCGRKLYATALCQSHYGQVRRGEAIRPVRPYRAAHERRRPVGPKKLRLDITVGEEAVVTLRRYALGRGRSLAAQARDVLETWAASVRA